MKVAADLSRCIGSGMCAHLAGQLVDVDDAGHVEVLRQPVDEAERDAAREAVEMCPAEALSIVDAGPRP